MASVINLEKNETLEELPNDDLAMNQYTNSTYSGQRKTLALQLETFHTSQSQRVSDKFSSCESLEPKNDLKKQHLQHCTLQAPFCTRQQAQKAVSSCSCTVIYLFFFRPTPDGSRQVVYQAGKTIAFCKLTELKLRQRRS